MDGMNTRDVRVPEPGGGQEQGADRDLDRLLGRVARGDQGAFEQVYDRLAGPAYGLIRKVVRDPAQSDEVADAVEANLDAERVRRCLSSLTDIQRESITLAYYGGYTYRQVAGLLNVALGTIKTRIRDGLIRLRDCMGVSW